MKLYYHKTSGGAEYLFDTFIPWKHNGKSGKEGRITNKTTIIVRIDGDIEKDAEINGKRVMAYGDLLEKLGNVAQVLYTHNLGDLPEAKEARKLLKSLQAEAE